MKKYVRAQIAAAILAVTAAPSMAADVQGYVEGFGGYAIGSRGGTGDIASGTGFGGDFGNSVTYGGGLGVKIPVDDTGFSFRFDLTGSNSPDLGGNNHTGTLDDGTTVSAKAKVKAATYLATAYIDMNLGLPVTPYVGFGVGGAAKKLNTLTFSGPAGAFATINGSGHSDFAWTGTVGATYMVMPHFEVDLGYRYVDAGRVVSGVTFTDLSNGSTQTLDSVISSRLQIHQVTAALRYLF
jgi:opacity protein-like surface antigen